ncbi:MAG: cyclic pyranopterin monophosphate synthase MoaC [Oligoflexia bacterium]|nr:cyclic pyranopterin monophosphate synthase MoaC [Oligoflexia bacterium]MBF0367146.1 cyclic pyranopterin monophosphate synthase MoaC [Oligoflexia bacterium]
MMEFTHLEKKAEQIVPKMVDVSSKHITTRVARARSIVYLPDAIIEALASKSNEHSAATTAELYTPKGPVFQTAIIAGTMAVKKNYELIPFCHQIPIESCRFNIDLNRDGHVVIECESKSSAKTGVEMEALTGASVAALTIYDMCKAYSSDIVIKEVRLLEKSGGKRDYHWCRDKLMGLVLAGGKSSRMGEDKTQIAYHGQAKTQLQVCCDLLSSVGINNENIFISCRKEQAHEDKFAGKNLLLDDDDNPQWEKVEGPLKGILSAKKKMPVSNGGIIVLAIDLPYMNQENVDLLMKEYDDTKMATSFYNREKKWCEPLCAIYSHHYFKVVNDFIERDGNKCPRKILSRLDSLGLVKRVIPTEEKIISNVNTPSEKEQVR